MEPTTVRTWGYRDPMSGVEDCQLETRLSGLREQNIAHLINDLKSFTVYKAPKLAL